MRAIFWFWAVALGSFLSSALFSAELAVSNRAPKADEIGYRPADGSTVVLNPPSFIWLHEKDAETYSIQWSKRADFAHADGAEKFIWNTYTHNKTFAPGTYFWRYCFTDKKGKTSKWSQVRKVTVPANAAAFPMPSRAEQRERIPKEHPRLFMRPEDLPRLRELAVAKLGGEFTKIRDAADGILKAGFTPEPTQMGSARDKNNKEAVKYWWPNREQTEKACKEAETLAFAYLISRDKKYGDGARRAVLALAAWNPDGPTNFALNCEAGKVMLYRPARAYDWAHDIFSPAERAKIAAALRRRVDDAWKSGEVGRGVGHLNSPYNSHGNRIWHKIAESALACYDEIPEAETWLDYAVNKFYSCYPVWADDDGGWHEGVSYWAGYQGKAVWWLQVSKSALGINGLNKPFFAQMGDYPLYVTPPGSPNSGFGDLSYRPPSSTIGGFMEYHIRMRGNQPDGDRAGYWRWWTEQWKMKGEGGILGFLYAANLPEMPPAKAPSDLPQSKVFRGIGVASLHTTLLNSADDVHFLFKSSPYGSQSHGHNPQNTFQLNGYGEPLLTCCVYRDLHGSKFHTQWVHETISQNGVLVDGKGQTKHLAAAAGRIATFETHPGWDYVAGDATETYGGRLNRAFRHVVFVKPRDGLKEDPFLVIYDDLESKEPATFQFMLHALKEFKIDERSTRLQVQQPKAGVTVQYVSPAALAFRQWDGFDPPPSKDFPNQWHVEAGTREKAKQLGMLTVLAPYRGKSAPVWSAKREENRTTVGVRFAQGDGQTTILFSKSGGAVSVQRK